MDVFSVDREERMFLFPATEEQVSASDLLIGGSSEGTAGCDWYDSPIFIGTNYYSAEEEVTLEDTGRWLPACTLIAMAVPYFDPEICRTTPTPSRFEFEMEMTLVVRFSGLSSATGMLYFEGTGEQTEFGAGGPTQTGSEFRSRAAIQLTR